MCTTLVLAQRPPYAGQRPTGYKDRLTSPSPPVVVASTDGAALADRFGASVPEVPNTTQRLPHLALGDAALVNQLNSRPIDQRPFWLVNSEAIEAQKNSGSNRPSSQPTNNVAPFASGLNTNTRPVATATTAPTIVQSTFTFANRLGEESIANQQPIHLNNLITHQEIVYPISSNPIIPIVPQRQNLILVQQYQPPQQWPSKSNAFSNNAWHEDTSDEYFY